MDFELQRLTIQINLNAARQPRSVVRYHDMRPPFQLDGRVALNAGSIIQPAEHHIGLQVPVLEIETQTVAVDFILRPAQNGTRCSLRINPGSQCERIVETEIRDVPNLYVALAVESRRLPHAPFAVPFAFFPHRLDD